MAAHLQGRILVVDDDAVGRRVVETGLARAGHEVIVATDVATALETLETSGPDAILVNLGIEGGAGAQLVRQIRSEVEWSVVPILVTSPLADPAMVREVAQCGVRRFLLRPFEMDVLLQEIQESLAESRSIRLLSASEAEKALGLDAGQYLALLGEVNDLLADAERRLREIEPRKDAPSDDLEPWSGVFDAVRKVAGAVSSIARGPFLEGGPVSDQGDGARFSLEDWRRLVLRDLRLLRGQIGEALGPRSPTGGDDAHDADGEGRGPIDADVQSDASGEGSKEPAAGPAESEPEATEPAAGAAS